MVSARLSCSRRGSGHSSFAVAKNELDDIRDDELAALKMLAAQMLAYDDAAVAFALAEGVLMEVAGDDEAIS